MPLIPDVVLLATMPGAGGAFAWFLVGIQRGRLRNDRLVRKALLECLGGCTVASFLAYPLAPLFTATSPITAVSFLVGAYWSHIMQVLRVQFTNHFTNQIGGGNQA
jgi:hypothetical protein